MRPFLAVVILLASIAGAEEITISQDRGEYQLNFDNIYTTFIHQDLELMVALPQGYKFLATIPGSRDFVSVGPIQNTVYISKPVPEDVMTNLTCHVLTPEGYEKKLIFKLIGKKGAPKVLAIQFIEPNTSQLNRTIEEIKSRYNEQLSSTMATQERELDKAIHAKTVESLTPWMINKRRGKIAIEYKGAELYLEGMFNSRGNTYIQLRTPIRADQCDIIQLKAVKLKKTIIEAEKVGVIVNDDNTFTYTYQIPEIQFSGKYHSFKEIKLTCLIKIWSKDHKLSFKAS